MSKLRLPPPNQISTDPRVNQGAVSHAQLVNDLLERWGNGNIDGSNIADSSITSAKILDGTIVNADVNSAAAIDLSKLASVAWSTYTPTWTATTTNPNVNYTITGRYIQVGKLVATHIELTSNGGGGGSYGTGSYLFSLPVTATSHGHSGTVITFDSSAGQVFMGYSLYDSTTTVKMITPAAPGVQYGPTVPFTWAINDFLQLDYIYEAA